ncbi:dienelactone hydrolase family protein [Mangrovicoccus sp. HB161399]|uniref:dienelactone hydrolase family protein n=1 Tax=Mangrovicoccus sp. HB161399 TaxID=2720392 RepID=UPI0015577D65|nr:dienelactone hydrolase family protein [Mangrovicoccus sp. HB161399]
MTGEDAIYSHAGLEMSGRFVAPETERRLPGILLLHGAHGLDGFILGVADRLAEEGFAVLAADLWGGREQPAGMAEIGPLIAGLAADRTGWTGRIEAARQVLAARSEVDPTRIGALGYCLGGAGVMEAVRVGLAIRSGVAFHPGIATVGRDWSAASRARLLLCVGAADPMGKADDIAPLTAAMDAAGTPWELTFYSGAKHAFTEPVQPGRPPFAGHDPWADRRSWAAMTDFFTLTLAED